MNPLFTLKNFRSFGETGATFEMAPLTVLTGCNSAGKSSLVKALMLICNSRSLVDESLELYRKDLALGTFDGVINVNSQNNTIELSYSIFSNYLQERVLVSRVYGKRKYDVVDDAHLESCTVTTEDGTLILKIFPINSYYTPSECNEEYLRAKVDDFSLVSRYYGWTMHEYSTLLTGEELRDNGKLSAEEVEEYNKLSEDIMKTYDDLMSSIKAKHIKIDNYDIDAISKWWDFLNQRNKEMRNRKDFLKKYLKKTETEADEEIKKFYPNSKIIEEFRKVLENEVCFPWFVDKKTKYVGSSNSQVKRVYPIEDESRFGMALRTYRNRKLSEEVFGGPDEVFYIGFFLNKWIKRFGIADRIDIKGDGEGSVKAFCIRGGQSRLLSDEGYGITHLVSLLLEIDNSINTHADFITAKWCEKDSVITIDYKNDSLKERLVCVEEPEVHLHPKYQSMLAEMFVEAYQKYNVHFVIETHSEYLIRKLQVMVADKECKLQSSDVSINYVEKGADGISTNRQIKIEEDGRLSEPFGEGFYDEADSLALELMRFKSRRK